MSKLGNDWQGSIGGMTQAEHKTAQLMRLEARKDEERALARAEARGRVLYNGFLVILAASVAGVLHGTWALSAKLIHRGF